MAIIATGSKTIIDLSDGKSLSAYLGSNQPRTQIYDVNAVSHSPDWTTTPGKLVITPVVYANQTAIALGNTALSITWKRKEGSGSEASLTTGESVSGNILTVTQNKLAAVASGLLTYIAYVTYTDPDTGLPINAVADITFALVRTGENAKSAWISGEQVFKYTSGGSASPAQITLTANLQNVSMSKWQYRNSGGVWTDYPTTADNANITGTTLNIKPAHAIWVGESATLRIVTSDPSTGDTTSIYKVTDGATGGTGAAGQNASVVFLSNENVTFAGDKDGKVAAITVACNVVAYTGTTKVTPTVGTITGAPTGMTVTKGSAASNEIPISIAIAPDTTLGAATPLQGTLTVPVTAPVNTTLRIAWSKVNTGAAGAAGADAVVFSLYAPNGTVFTNGEGTLTIQAAPYVGSTPITTGATYAWEKYTSGSWTTVAGQAGSSLTVGGGSVLGMASFRCTMAYGGKTYQDVITLTDKTDNYQADIDSTAGDIFKNTVGNTCLICRLWQNGVEVDPLKATTYSTTAPGSPTTGAFYYKIVTTTPTTALMRYSGSTWADVTTNATYEHTKTYTWYRRDKDGNPLGGGAAFATGKVIYVDGDDVENKTVFVCEVEQHMTLIARAYITIANLNDPIQQGDAPSNPIEGMLWLDTSKSPPMLRRWSGSAWEQVNEVKVGGVNLVDGGRTYTITGNDTDTSYWIAADELYPDRTHTLSIREIIKDAGASTGVTWRIMNMDSGVIVESGTLEYTYGRQIATFTTPATQANWGLILYPGIVGATNGVTVTFNYVQLEEGTLATTWRPSINDSNNQVGELGNVITSMEEGFDARVQALIDDLGLSDQFASTESFLAMVDEVGLVWSEFNQQEDSIGGIFTRLDASENSITTMLSHFEFGGSSGSPYLDMWASTSNMRMRLTNTRLSFLHNGNEVAYFSDNKLHITQAEVSERISIGTSNNGRLDIVTTPSGVGFKWRS